MSLVIIAIFTTIGVIASAILIVIVGAIIFMCLPDLVQDVIGAAFFHVIEAFQKLVS